MEDKKLDCEAQASKDIEEASEMVAKDELVDKIGSVCCESGPALLTTPKRKHKVTPMSELFNKKIWADNVFTEHPTFPRFDIVIEDGEALYTEYRSPEESVTTRLGDGMFIRGQIGDEDV